MKYQQAKIRYEEAEIDVAAVIEKMLDKDEVSRLRGIEVIDIDSCDEDGEITFTFRYPGEEEDQAYYSTHSLRDQQTWNAMDTLPEDETALFTTLGEMIMERRES